MITQRNGNLFLLFRLGNMRSSHLLEAHVRAQFIHKVGGGSNEKLPEDFGVFIKEMVLYIT